MLLSFWRSNMAARKQQKPNLSLSFPAGVNTSSEEPKKVKVIFILRDARSQKKSVTLLTYIRAFPAAS